MILPCDQAERLRELRYKFKISASSAVSTCLDAYFKDDSNAIVAERLKKAGAKLQNRRKVAE